LNKGGKPGLEQNDETGQNSIQAAMNGLSSQPTKNGLNAETAAGIEIANSILHKNNEQDLTLSLTQQKKK